MKPYGVPRLKWTEYPDVADIKRFGFKTSVGGKDYFKNKSSKKSTRRIWKRKARKINFDE